MKRLCITLMLTVWIAIQFSSAWAFTVSVRVNTGNDDAEEIISDGSMYLNSTDLEASYDDFQGGLQIVGMRFTGLTIPQGATINSAYIEFETDETDAGVTNLVIVGEAIDDASTFGVGANNISGRNATLASINWSPGAWNTVNELHQTSDIATIIKEIVDRGGWVSGNSLVILIEPGGGCVDINCQRTAESWDGEAAAAALLVVDYTVGGSASVCETYRDNFSVVSYANQDGSMNWSADWVEVNDNGSPASGDIRITNAGELRIKDNDRSISRSADLSSYATATLTFDYRETGFDNAADYVDLEIRAGGGGWQLLQRFASPAVNTGSTSLIINPLLLAIDTEVRFITSASLGNNDRFRIDNFQIEACSSPAPTVDSLTTSDTTPIVTGTYDSAGSAGGFTVQADGITYTLGVSVELTNVGDDWSLDLNTATPLAIGVYDVVATSDDGAGNISTDATTNELTIITPVCTATFRDEFSASSFANNDGDTNFTGNWDEYEGTSATIPEASPDPSSGHIQISGGQLMMNNHSPESQNFRGVERELNLIGYVSATFSFDFVTSGGVDATDSFVVMASSNGGASWTVLEDIRGIVDISASRTYDLTPFISANTKIRMRFNNEADSGLGTACCYGGVPETISIDNVNIDATGPCMAVDHFNINVGAGAANTCNPFSFTVTAEDSSNNPVIDYTGTVTITTSTANGNFSAVTATNNVNPNPDNDDNGSAGYTFDLLDTGSVTLAIANDHAETLTISVSDATVPVTTISASITFSDNAFTIIDNDLLVAGDNVPVAGRSHSYQIQMIRRDPIIGCGVATGYTGLKPLKMWRSKNAADPSPNDPALAGFSLPAADPGVNNGNITFANGVADVALATIDIGKFTIELTDISNTFADITIAGTSAEQTVRPFGLAVTNIIAGATVNPGANTPAGGIFTAAGANFSATVSSVLWDGGDDLDNDGILDTGIFSDNVIAPSYAWDTTLSVSPIGFEPATGIPGNLINGGILQAEFSAGSFTPNDLQYTEVGSFTLQAAANDFLGESTADLVGDDIIVGRFTPASLLISSTVDGMLANINPCVRIYTYIGESFTYDVIHPSFEVSAMNSLAVPAVTQNYTGLWARLDDSSITLTNPTSDGTQLGSDLLTLMALTYTQDASLYNITDNADGTFNYEFANDQFVYDRDVNSEISPFNSDIDLIITDVTDLDAVTNAGTFTLQPLSLESRFGRIKMGNIHGSELIDLAMPMRVEYLDPAGLYVANTDDNCTVVTTADLAITDNLSVPGSSIVTVTNPMALAGDLGVSLTAPGAGVDGNIIVSPGLTGVADWLQYDWDSIGLGLFDDDPSAIATFGIYSGNDVNIYKQQIYQE